MSIVATPAHVAHLLRRAGFTALPADIARGMDDGIDATVDRLLRVVDDPPTDRPDIPAAKAQADDNAESHHERLRDWWVRRMATSPNRALERLTWCWHDHFATAADKVFLDELMWQQNLTLRANAFGKFADLALSMLHDPAMISFLDLHSSRKDAPNENFSREVMELFVLGYNSEYSQRDVREAGRAFTGYQYKDGDWDNTYAYGFRVEDHDNTNKTVLGTTGPLTGEDVVGLLVARPESARFIAYKLWISYGSPDPDAALIDELGSGFAEHGSIAELLLEIWTHPVFYSESVRKARVTEPVEWLVRVLIGLDLLGAPELNVNDRLWELGQLPFDPPNVGGWPPTAAWMEPHHIAARVQCGRYMSWIAMDEKSRAECPGAASLFAQVAEPSAFVVEAFGRFGVPPEAIGQSSRAVVEGHLARHASRLPDDGRSVAAEALALVLSSVEVIT